jgi:hypothetical protein
MIGTQFVVDQAPRGGPPDTCPILNDVAGNLLFTRTLLGTNILRIYAPRSSS